MARTKRPQRTAYTAKFMNWDIYVDGTGDFVAELGNQQLRGKSLPGLKKKITGFVKTSITMKASGITVWEIDKGYDELPHKIETYTLCGLKTERGTTLPIWKKENGEEVATTRWTTRHTYYKPDPKLKEMLIKLDELHAAMSKLANEADELERAMAAYGITADQVVADAQKAIIPTKNMLLAKPGFDRE